MKKIHRHIQKNATYFLLVGLLLHILVVHGMFKSNVIGLDDGTTSIEYTFDGTSNTAHNNVLSAKHESIDDSKDVSLSGQYDYNNEILIKGPNNVIVKVQIFSEILFNFAANEVHPIFYTNLTSNNSTSLTQFKTVSLLI